MAAGTGKARLDSPLQRKQWLLDNLLKKTHRSFWTVYTGNSSASIVYNVNDFTCGKGKTVVFDFDGILDGGVYGHDEVTYGNGEIKRKFSDSLVIDEFNHVVANGNRFDACEIADLTITQHSHSVGLLGDLYMRYKDQFLFDTAQGADRVAGAPSHIYDLGTTFEYNDLVLLEHVAETGEGLKAPDANGIVSSVDAPARAPLDGWHERNGEAEYILMIDGYMDIKIKTDPKYQTVMMNADSRGSENRLLKGRVGSLGRITIVKMPKYAGSLKDTVHGAFGQLDHKSLKNSGARRYARLDDGTIAWEGSRDFAEAYALWLTEKANGTAHTVEIYSRGLLLGAGALQKAMGFQPDYKFQASDFGKTSESLIEYFQGTGKTKLIAEIGSDYKGAKVTDIDYGIIAVDIKHV